MYFNICVHSYTLIQRYTDICVDIFDKSIMYLRQISILTIIFINDIKILQNIYSKLNLKVNKQV